ncbi:hypothetical protein LSH36_1357g00009 [Paralvinella palmiformis]|uniref:Nucleotide-diphospho-sugar transferase domain-containing protein n=1 Tax=Paralvinella palmiformis TaxID=53620 RepID=A0AAD9MPB6_9ANNE|nr:hypothetical protein LSH36_1357g00009 [Paralvinella palmiformis]
MGIRLFDHIVKMITSKPVNDQVYMNRAVRKLGKKIKIRYLPGELFQLGNVFFTKGHRIFIGDNPCNECVLVHNNYIVSLEAKIYRFKEYGLWEVDGHGYYSDSDRKYISYDNPIEFNNKGKYKGFATEKMELMSLKAAFVIGRILNRTVILPKFHCHGAKGYNPLPGQMCHFGTHYSMRKFESYLPALTTYREHVFLEHPMVPKMINESKSEPFLIDGPVWQHPDGGVSNHPDSLNVLKPKGDRVLSTEVRKWFASKSARILVFHSLYNEFDSDNKEVSDMLDILSKAIKNTDFMQLHQ